MSYNPAFCLMNDDPKFRTIRDYYKMYSHEMSQGSLGLSQTITSTSP